ncbi:choice-of-anchor J domain-containing protein, partial [Candidatus Babeliales bacterium]|nr:choice-of-anchor J domain-containing protein [Candidatus Babeliales bacterium]
NYPRYTDSRLISPSISLICEEEIFLSFRHWFSYSGGDYGYVQISVYDEALSEWSAWSRLSNNFTPSSDKWTAVSLDLTAYKDKKVRIAFYHTDDNDYDQSSGWYIDHIRVTGFPHFCECDLNQDGRCDMSDWLLFGEDWGRTDCGTPPGSGYWPNDCKCDLNHDGRCDMLDWLRFGEDWGQTDCLLCE